MLRHSHLLSLTALGLALAATLSEEDNPPDDVEPSPEPCPDDCSGIASIDAALRSLNFMIGGPGNGKGMFALAQQARRPVTHDVQASRAASDKADICLSMTTARGPVRPEQRANKKARAKRKAKKGWT